MLGGGQLGRMFIDAAHRRGFRVAVLCPDAAAPAHQVADRSIVGDYESEDALREMADCCSAASYEFENVPERGVRFLERMLPVHPSSSALAYAQHRGEEKLLAERATPQTPPVPWRIIESEQDLLPAWEELGGPCILKTARFGYDGKGQYRIESQTQLTDSYADAGHVPCVLEKRLDLAAEISVLTARGPQGSIRYPVVENTHRNGILHRSLSPARVADELAHRAQDSAAAIANSLDYRGVLAVEYFIDREERIYFNEMAPRPHNSGHHTIDSCDVSQFDQQVLALTGAPPEEPTQHTPAVMINLLGDLWQEGEPDWGMFAEDPNLHLHLYGKHEARPGRKMGHFCVLDPDPDAACARAEELFGRLAS